MIKKEEKKLPQDNVARKKIIESLDVSYFVEAGAGSGKTESLSGRLAALISTNTAKIENIAAITFTRKAAAELRERFQQKLEEADPENNAFVRKALSDFELASIGTVHSFCAKLLRERPVEAGVDPGFEELEEAESLYYAGEVWDEFVNRQFVNCSIKPEGKNFFDWLFEHGVDISTARSTYFNIIDYPEVEKVTGRGNPPDFKEAKERVKAFVKETRELFKKETIDAAKGMNAPMKEMLRSIFKYESLGYLEDDKHFYEMLTELENKKNPKPARPPIHAVYDLHEDLLLINIPELKKTWQEHLHKPLIDFAKEASAYFTEWRRQRSLLNFQDLLMKTAALLRENTEVRKFFRDKIRFLLVDEFQDTDPIQAEIVFFLTGKEENEKDWTKITTEPGALFLVGDPKQSIFRFRRADIDIYRYVKEKFGKSVLELNVNFRSYKAIEEATNDVFEKELGKGNAYQAEYKPMQVYNEEKIDDGGVFWKGVARQVRHNRQLTATEAAVFAASWIKEALDGKNEQIKKKIPGDFMIITRNKDCLSIYAKELEKRGIPYEITGGKDFKNSEDVREFVTLLKALVDYRNQVAIVGALRGAFFGLSDAELYEYTKAGGKFGYIGVSGEAKGNEKVRSALALLKDLKELVNENDPLTALYGILEKTGFIPFLMSKELGASRAGNIFKTIELVRNKHKESVGSFAEMVDRIIEFSEFEEDIEEMSIFPEAANAVRIMNIHKAKGLEAGVIILADPVVSTREHRRFLHVKREGNSSLGYFAATNDLGEYTAIVGVPPGWDEAMKEALKYEEEEEKRLDYVALTRAKKAVLIFFYPRLDDDGKKDLTQHSKWQRFRAYAETKGHPAVVKSFDIIQSVVKTIKAEKIAKEKKAIFERLNLIGKNSYELESVTSLSKGKDSISGSFGEGAAWGRIVHRALELCGHGQKDRLAVLAKNWLFEEGIPEEQYEKLMSLINTITTGPIWERLTKSKEKYFEVPFTILQDNIIISGTIDLVFKDEELGGWVLVDYKTDDFYKDEKRHESYGKQIDMYCDCWEKLTGEKVKERKLLTVK